MKNKIPLTKSKKKWLGNRSVVLRGEKLNYNAAQQQKYSQELKKLVDIMIKETKSKIIELFKSENSKKYFKKQKNDEKMAMDESISSQARIITNQLMDKFDKLFTEKSKKLSKKMVKDISSISKTNLHSSLKKL